MDFHWTSTVLGLIEAIIVRVQTDQSTGGRLLRVGSRSAEGKAHSGAEAAHLHTSDPSQARTMRIHVHTLHGLHSMDTTSISPWIPQVSLRTGLESARRASQHRQRESDGQPRGFGVLRAVARRISIR